MTNMAFQKSERKKSRLRLALTGPSGSGKTYSALLIAKGIGGKTAVVDTEKGSASLYTHLTDFDVLELTPPYSPERFIEAVDAAAKAGYQILIIDSITHEWSGVGGSLELVDEIARSKYKGKSWSAWNEITPRHRKFLDALLSAPLHIIATMRSKTETAQTEENGRKKVVKLGMKAEQRESSEYEFTTVLDIVHDGHYAVASKDRTGLFTDKDPKPITVETGRTILAWLNAGVERAPAPAASAPPPPTEAKVPPASPPPAAAAPPVEASSAPSESEPFPDEEVKDLITDAQVKKIQTLFTSLGIKDREMKRSWVKSCLGLTILNSIKDLMKNEASRVIDSLELEEQKKGAA